jgi:hypothetical protein
VRLTLWIVFLLVLAACSGEQMSCEVVSSLDGQTLSLRLDGSHVEIVAGAQHLSGETKVEQRVYQDGGRVGPMVLDVKASEYGFKLRGLASELLWKVRFEPNKIKVSNNDENEHAWTIKLEPGGEGKVRDPSEQVVGRVVRAEESGLSVVNDAGGKQVFAVRAGPHSIAYGVLLMHGIPETERRVILAELLALGK